MAENFYDILGVSEKSTKDEIKKAYRGMQMKYHPDKNSGSQESVEMTKKINEAYETLGDEQARAQYDNARLNPNPFSRMTGQGGGGGMEVPIDDIFNMFFGGGMNPFGMPQGMPQGMPPGTRIHIFNGRPMGFQQAMSKPLPIMKTITINMEQVLNGANIPIEVERWVMENDLKVFESETIYVTIPQGIDENEMIILRDKGHVINETVKGDVKLSVKIANDTTFKRSGLDLIIDKTISLKESLCGFTFEIKYLNGKAYTLNNNKGNIIPPEYRKIYPNMGLTRGEHKGNMIIHFHIDFPEKLTDDQIAKLSEAL
ncbi:MAG: DnaJ domain-containing protein [Candidatus Marinimicrobia bacterium]|nr:DnaJ domain-containing protein [Candidatus Neomarinimicrobiota bacterium]